MMASFWWRWRELLWRWGISPLWQWGLSVVWCMAVTYDVIKGMTETDPGPWLRALLMLVFFTVMAWRFLAPSLLIAPAPIAPLTALGAAGVAGHGLWSGFSVTEAFSSGQAWYPAVIATLVIVAAIAAPFTGVSTPMTGSLVFPLREGRWRVLEARDESLTITGQLPSNARHWIWCAFGGPDDRGADWAANSRTFPPSGPNSSHRARASWSTPKTAYRTASSTSLTRRGITSSSTTGMNSSRWPICDSRRSPSGPATAWERATESGRWVTPAILPNPTCTSTPHATDNPYDCGSPTSPAASARGESSASPDTDGNARRAAGKSRIEEIQRVDFRSAFEKHMMAR